MNSSSDQCCSHCQGPAGSGSGNGCSRTADFGVNIAPPLNGIGRESNRIETEPLTEYFPTGYAMPLLRSRWLCLSVGLVCVSAGFIASPSGEAQVEEDVKAWQPPPTEFECRFTED